MDKIDFDDFSTFSERVKKSTKVTVEKMKNQIENIIRDIEKNINNKSDS